MSYVVITWQALDRKEQQDILSTCLASVSAAPINMLTGCNILHSSFTPRYIQTMKTIIWTSASEERKSLSLSDHPAYIRTHQSEIICHFSAVKLAPVKAPVTISGDICFKLPFSFLLTFFLFLTLSLLYWNRFCLDRDCVFVCVHVCGCRKGIL